MFATFGLLESSASMAMGYLVSRATAKFRQPLAMGMAVALSRMFPVLTRFNASALLGAVMPNAPNLPNNSPPSAVGRAFAKLSAGLFGVTDRYAVSYIVSTKALTITTTLAATAALNHGFDTGPWLEWLEWLGVGETAQTVGGSMVAAGIINGLLLPVHGFVAILVCESIRRHKLLDHIDQYFAGACAYGTSCGLLSFGCCTGRFGAGPGR